MATNEGNKIVTRFAPSPTGFLHIGGARTALFNYLFAKKHGGRFVLRIEDTDMQRNSEEATEAILVSMKWLGLDWDEGPIYQSKRFDIYRSYAEKMIGAQKAYRCFCTPERLEEMRAGQTARGENPKYDRKCSAIPAAEAAARAKNGEKCVVRFTMPAGEKIEFDDMVHGALSFMSDTLDDFVIIKSDGTPTYNFAVAIDDHDMNISHVIRGDDHISNTPKQIQILRALGFGVPRYGHVPMILGADKTKLSKRHGATSLTWYEEAGYLREAIINYLALLGWSLDGTSEFFTMADLVEKFTAERINSTPAVFDLTRLAHFNSHYIKNMEIGARTSLMMDYARKHMPALKFEEKHLTRDNVSAILTALGDRLKVLPDFAAYAEPFLNDATEISPEVAAKTKKDFTAETFGAALDAIERIVVETSPFDAASLEAALRAAQVPGVNFSKCVFLIRSAVTGRNVSPGIFDVLLLAGRERSLARIAAYRETMKKEYQS